MIGLGRVCTVMMMAAAGQVHAARLYVSTDGREANDGSREKPWPSVEHALSRVGAGNTIVVRPGFYRGTWQIRGFAAKPDGSPTQPPGVLRSTARISRDGRTAPRGGASGGIDRALRPASACPHQKTRVGSFAPTPPSGMVPPETERYRYCVFRASEPAPNALPRAVTRGIAFPESTRTRVPVKLIFESPVPIPMTRGSGIDQ
jgi:hypothetical protein